MPDHRCGRAAQQPIKDKGCEITAIPEWQILSQEEHFVMMVKKNQPQAYGEIVKYFGEMSEDRKRMEKEKDYRPRYPEMQRKYEEISQTERNRDRQEYRWYSVCTDCSLLTRTQEEWPFIKTAGMARQVRIPVERDAEGKDITPDINSFLKKIQDKDQTCPERRGGRRYPGNGDDIGSGTDSRRNGADQKGALGSREPFAPCAGRYIPRRQVTGKKIQKREGLIEVT